jgi:hypothetical protein
MAAVPRLLGGRETPCVNAVWECAEELLQRKVILRILFRCSQISVLMGLSSNDEFKGERNVKQS